MPSDTDGGGEQNDFGLSAYDANFIERIAHEAGTAAAAAQTPAILEAVNKAIEGGFTKYFGEISADKHVAQHTRIETFLKFLDRTSKSFWQGVAYSIGKVVAVAAIGYIGYQIGKHLP